MSVSLESRLQSVGAHIDYPPAPDVVAAVLRDTRPSRAPARRRLIAAVAVVVVVVAAVTALIPGARDTVKAWFGIGDLEIERVDPLDLLPSDLSLGDPATLPEAAGVIGMAVPGSDLLGFPDAVFVDPQRVTLVFGSELPDDALLLTLFRGDLEPAILKQLPDDTSLELVVISGEAGIWISGEPHAVEFIDGDGRFQEDSGRLAGNSLLWEMGVLTLRLEGVSDLERAIEIAESFTS